jgi:hypothetical protein
LALYVRGWRDRQYSQQKGIGFPLKRNEKKTKGEASASSSCNIFQRLWNNWVQLRAHLPSALISCEKALLVDVSE